MTSDEKKDDVQHYRRMASGPTRTTMGLTLAAERCLAAISIQRNGHAALGETIAGNPLSGERTSLRVPAGTLRAVLNDHAQACLVNSLWTSFDRTATDGELDLLSDIEEKLHIQTMHNVEVLSRARTRPPGKALADLPPSVPLEKPPQLRVNAPLLPSHLLKKDQAPYEIDLLIHGLLGYYGIDIEALRRELDHHSGRPALELSSPSARSNHAIPLESLGHSFPPAIFRLRGRTLETRRLVLDGKDDEGLPVHWRWSPPVHSQRGPTIEADAMLPRLDLYRSARRSVSSILSDERIHPSLRVASARRETGPGAYNRVIVEIHPRSVPLIRDVDIPEQRTAPSMTPMRMPVWMEPEGHSPKEESERLIRMIIARRDRYRFKVTAQTDHVELDLALIGSRTPPLREHEAHMEHVQYRFVQEDFRSDAILSQALDRVYRDHELHTRTRRENEETRRRERERREEKARQQQALKFQRYDEERRRVQREHEARMVLIHHIMTVSPPASTDERHLALTYIKEGLKAAELPSGWDKRITQRDALIHALAPRHSPLIPLLALRDHGGERPELRIVRKHDVARLDFFRHGDIAYAQDGFIHRGSKQFMLSQLTVTGETAAAILDPESLVGRGGDRLIEGYDLGIGVRVARARRKKDSVVIALQIQICRKTITRHNKVNERWEQNLQDYERRIARSKTR